ncbi:hypothetical protein SRABI112_03792 [Pseudomonas mediterranea]|nr:hypothetical protein SRABI112_03792 [Pseudomonas mediterranea]
MLGQFAQGGLGEQGAQVDLGTEILVQAGLQLHGQQGMATEFEEAVVPADLVQVQQVFPDLGDGDFGVTLRRFVGLAGEGFQAGLGQGATVELAVGGEGQGVQVYEGTGHHVLGQVFEQGAAQLFGTGRFTAQVGHQAIVVPGYDHGVGDAGTTQQHVFDFAQFDTEPADLHLEVVPAQVLQRAIGQPATEVAGLVQAGVRLTAERIGDKALGTQLRPVQVTPGHADTADMDFPGHPQRCRFAPRIQHVDLDVGEGATDARPFTQVADQVDGSVHRALGGAVHVVEADALAVAQFLPSGGVDRLATEQHAHRLVALALQQAGGEQGVELRRRGVEGVHLVLFEEVQQLAAAGADQLRDDHQAMAGEQLRDALDRHVEEEPGVEGHGGRGRAVLVGGAGQHVPEVEHRAVLDHHALGLAGGAGGVDHVGQVFRGQARYLWVAVERRIVRRLQRLHDIQQQHRQIPGRQR